MGDVAPVAEECKRVDAQIHAVFVALLADALRTKREKAKIRELYLTLVDQGTLTPSLSEMQDDADPFVPSFVDESPTAERPLDRSTIRTLFRRMAEALHPDKVQDEEERLYRTELMKEVTSAYHQGDLARLLDLERALKNGVSAGAPETAERRCEKVSEEIQELRVQLREIERAMRALKKDPAIKMAAQFTRGAAGALLIEEARQEATTLGKILDFVRSFQQGAIPLADFLDGPDLGYDEEDDPMEVVDRMMADMAMFGGAPAGSARRAPPKRTPAKAKAKARRA